MATKAPHLGASRTRGLQVRPIDIEVDWPRCLLDVAPKKKIKNSTNFFVNFLNSPRRPEPPRPRRRGRRGGEAGGSAGRCCRGMRTAEHRGIGPGCWPTEVGARARRLRDCLLHCAPFCPGATAAVLWRWLTA